MLNKNEYMGEKSFLLSFQNEMSDKRVNQIILGRKALQWNFGKLFPTPTDFMILA